MILKGNKIQVYLSVLLTLTNGCSGSKNGCNKDKQEKCAYRT